MGNLPFEEEKALKNFGADLDMARDTNQFSMQFAKMVFNCCFLLNGAAATALLASKIPALFPAAVWCAFGAVIAILAMGIAYWYVMSMLNSWFARPKKPGDKCIPVFVFWKMRVESVTFEQLERYRAIPVVCVVLSITLFAVGIYNAATADF